MDLLAAENDIIAKLNAGITEVKAQSYPNSQNEIFRLLDRNGAILVHYDGSVYEEPTARRTKKVIQRRAVQWSVILCSRGITGPNIETVRTAAYDILEKIRTTLTGYTVNSLSQSEVMRPVRDSIIAQDKDKGIWFYEFIFVHALDEVEAYK